MRDQSYFIKLCCSTMAMIALSACSGGGDETTSTTEPAAAATPTPTPAACTAAPINPSEPYSLVFKGCSATNEAEYYDKAECVRDNATGYIWQGQTPAGSGLRANDQKKTNYDSTTALQKETIGVGVSAPTQAEVDALSNSIGFKNAVNASALCGRSTWEVPSQAQLRTLVKSGSSPAIDATWFPNLSSGKYWTSTSSATVTNARLVNFADGSDWTGLRGYTPPANVVRLVSTSCVSC